MIRRVLCDFILRWVQTDEIHGIRLVDFGKPEHEFTRHMRAALELIREVDPRRFAWVQRLRRGGVGFAFGKTATAPHSVGHETHSRWRPGTVIPGLRSFRGGFRVSETR
jgi:hypothetical protein